MSLSFALRLLSLAILRLHCTESSSTFVASSTTHHEQSAREHRRYLAAGGSKSSSTVLWDNSADDDALPAGNALLEDNVIGGGATVTSLKKRTPLDYYRKEQSNNDRCIPVDDCEYCTAETINFKNSNRNDEVPQECIATGRRRRHKCPVDSTTSNGHGTWDMGEHYFPSNNATSSTTTSMTQSSEERSSSTNIVYKSCRSTPAEDYYVFLRMQLICLILGILSLRQVNKQKRLSASIFDQRKYGGSNSSNSSTASATKLIRKSSDAVKSYMPVPMSDKNEDNLQGTASKTKSSTAKRLYYAESVECV